MHSSSFYSSICDEAIDFSKTEQLSFTVLHCKFDYDVKEDFIGVFPCTGGVTSEALLKYVKNLLVRCNMDPQKMVGILFDGASSMKNLAKLIKENVAQQALYVHCFAHANELVFKDATAQSPMIAYAQDFCEDLYALVGIYLKRVLLFESIQKDMEGDKSIVRLKNLSKTRWTTRGVASEVIIKRRDALRETLNKLANDKTATPECLAKSRGLIEKV